MRTGLISRNSTVSAILVPSQKDGSYGTGNCLLCVCPVKGLIITVNTREHLSCRSAQFRQNLWLLPNYHLHVFELPSQSYGFKALFLQLQGNREVQTCDAHKPHQHSQLETGLGLARAAWEVTAATQLMPQTIHTLVDRGNTQIIHQEIEIIVSMRSGGEIKYYKGSSAIETVFKCCYYA